MKTIYLDIQICSSSALESTNQQYDDYINRLFAPEDETLIAIRAEMARENIRPINVSPSGGKTLHFFARLIGAKWILEIGTLGGYSATWLARALPADGRLVSVELEPHHAEVSRRNLARAGLADKVEVRIGPAATTLQAMHTAGEHTAGKALFDLVFINANKEEGGVVIEEVTGGPAAKAAIRGGNHLLQLGNVQIPLWDSP